MIVYIEYTFLLHIPAYKKKTRGDDNLGYNFMPFKKNNRLHACMLVNK